MKISKEVVFLAILLIFVLFMGLYKIQTAGTEVENLLSVAEYGIHSL